MAARSISAIFCLSCSDPTDLAGHWMDGGTGASVFIPRAYLSMTATLQVAQDAKTRVNFQQNLT